MTSRCSPDRIEAFSAYAVRVPLDKPILAGRTPLSSRDYLCVDIRTATGLRGIGFSYLGTRGAESAFAIARELIAPRLLGCAIDWNDVPGVAKQLNMSTLIQGRAGLVLNVISAVDIAVWDAAAKRANVPLAALLGATRDHAEVYGSGGYYQTEDGLSELDAELDRWQALGITRVKLKMKGLPTQAEFARLEMARRSVGDAGLLMLDFYHGFTGRSEAAGFVGQTEPFAPYWIEDPFEPDDLDSFAWLAQQTGMRLATGEFQSSPIVFDHIGLIGAASVVQAEAPRCGGVSGWLNIARRSERFGMLMSPCWFHQLHVHLVLAVSNSLFVEYFDGTDILNFDKLIEGGARLVGDQLHISSRPGLGFDFDRDNLLHHSIAQFELCAAQKT